LLRESDVVPVQMDGLTFAQQAELFAQAELVVASHGAALTNLIFAPEGSTIIELFPPGVRDASYFTAATHSKLAYYYLMSRVTRNGANSAMSVDLQKLSRLLIMAGQADVSTLRPIRGCVASRGRR
jgi:capsular polysaccharide biosynthesis protein